MSRTAFRSSERSSVTSRVNPGSPSATVTIVVSDVFLKPMVKEVVRVMLEFPAQACVLSNDHSPAK